MIFDFLNNRIESSFNIGLSIKAGSHEIVAGHFRKTFLQFCQDLNLGSNFLHELPFDTIFTDVEFNKHIPDENEESFINKTFYPKVFKDIKKQETGKVDFHTKFCFTMDKTLTAARTVSGINYGSLNLGSKPVLFYLWIDVQEIINLVKAS